MAKGKKKKSKMNAVIKAEITGLLCLVFSVLLAFGIGTFFRLISSVFIFFIGYAVYPIYLFLFVYAITIIIGRKVPTITFAQKISVVLVTLSVLVFTSVHNVVDEKVFLEYGFELFDSISNYVKLNEFSDFSGGIIGFTLADISMKLFNFAGTIIIFATALVIAFILFFQKSIFSFIKKAEEKPAKEKKIKEKKVKEKKEKVVKPPKEKKVKTVKTAKPAKPAVINPNKKMKIYKFDEANDIEESPVVAPSRAEVAAEPPVEVPAQQSKVTKESIEVPKNGKYNLPPSSLLASPSTKNSGMSKQELEDRADLLVRTLNEFGVSSSVVAINVGPTVTQFEIELQVGTKLSKIKNLSGEIALSLAAKDVRIQAPIPQKSTVGVEIPNTSASLVTLKEILQAIPASETNKTVFALGKDIMGKPVYTALNKMPHLLVAGATGSGKSVCINAMIISLAMRAKPEEVKMLMIDPKKVELSGYNGLPHLLAPVVTDPKKAAMALQKIVAEMERRYDMFSEIGCKNFESFNEKMEAKNLTASKIPYIIVIVDELADLMLVASKEVEDAIMRITQMARAAGIHLIVATQRPSTDIITGVIKSNIPSRIAFGVSSSIDSRTILDSVGAEKLLGKGDMLFVPMGTNNPTRIQGAFLSDEEVENVVYYCAKQQLAQFDENILSVDKAPEPTESEDDMYNEVLDFVLENGSASTSLLQRRFRIGYNRASRLIDDLEMNGIIGPQNGSKPREVITDLVSRG